jgi:hypothetical protein
MIDIGLGLVVRAARRILPALGRLGKGKATVAGVVAVVAAAGSKQLLGDVITSENVVEVINALATVVQALGVVIAAFGFGRKAREAALRDG